MKITIFDFKDDWHLVEPHLNDPEVTELFDQGMLGYSLYDKWDHLPLWDVENGHGPWEYTKLDAFSEYAMERASEDPQQESLDQKYSKILEKEGLEWETFFEYDGEDPKVISLLENYEEDRTKIEKKYYPQINTYRWYQCFGAADFLSGWSKKLAEKIFPEYTWKTYRKYKEKTVPGHNFKMNSGCTTTIGKNKNGDFLIFDIMLFNNESIDGILEAVGLDRNKLRRDKSNR